MHIEEIIATHPDVKGSTNDALISCIESCYDCAQACVSCADACLAEPMVQQLTQCIRLNLDCADICGAAGSIATRRTGSNEQVIQSVLEACALACRVCEEECARHADDHEHCKICAAACERCARACQAALQSFGGKGH
jgi:hypothetical protein